MPNFTKQHDIDSSNVFDNGTNALELGIPKEQSKRGSMRHSSRKKRKFYAGPAALSQQPFTPLTPSTPPSSCITDEVRRRVQYSHNSTFKSHLGPGTAIGPTLTLSYTSHTGCMGIRMTIYNLQHGLMKRASLQSRRSWTPINMFSWIALHKHGVHLTHGPTP